MFKNLKSFILPVPITLGFRLIKPISATLLMVFSTGMSYAGNGSFIPDVKIVQQSESCNGTVKESSGEVVIGASVLVKGTTNGAITDMDGKFTLSNVAKGSTIIVSYVGYKAKNFLERTPSIYNLKRRFGASRGSCSCWLLVVKKRLILQDR